MLGQKFFLLLQKWEKGESTYLHPNDCTKQERSALWSFPNFLRDLTMCFGSGRAKTVCPWPETLIPGWSWNALAFCSCMGKKQTPPQSCFFSVLLLLTLSKWWGFASYYVHIFVIFWPAHGSILCGMCPRCCCLMLTEVTAFPLRICAAAGVQSACLHPQSWLQRRQLIAQHRAFSTDWLLFLERIVGCLCEGDMQSQGTGACFRWVHCGAGNSFVWHFSPG